MPIERHGEIPISEFKRRRTRLGLRQDELAKYMRVHRSTVARMENGLTHMPPGMDLFFEGLEDRMIREGYELHDDPRMYRVVKRGVQFFRYPKDRSLPQGVTEIDGATGEDGLLHLEYTNLPLVFSFGYVAKHVWRPELPPEGVRQPLRIRH